MAQKLEDDTRKIAVYARKSKMTEQGKSIDNQIIRCKEYVHYKFNASDEDISVYIDEGLSGFYSDRPNYMRMLRDISDNKIRMLVCYKFDRISRKTIDLLKLVDNLNLKKIDFISCSDDIDTSTRSGKMMITFLATIAEFERDIIAERISDNMYELSKDGRWLGGTTPTGYASRQVFVRTNGKKTSINYLEVVPDEFETVKSIFNFFLEERSLVKVSDALKSESKNSKGGKEYTAKAIKAILQNPVYCAADKTMYNYFSSLDVPVYKDRDEFDGSHGLMVYNKTQQLKVEKDDSTFLEAKYVQQTLKKDLHDWIVSIGQHTPVVSGNNWLTAQSILQSNKDKYNRPHESTESLLSGILLCPICGSPMIVRSDSGRYTADGKLRYHYVCRSKMQNHSLCPNSPNVGGNELDDFVVNTICSMCNPDNEYYKLLTDDKTQIEFRSTELDVSIMDVQKRLEQIAKDIDSQTQNLRDASDAVKHALFSDIDSLSQERDEKKALLLKLKEEQQEKEKQSTDIESVKKVVMSFPALAKVMPYQEKMELLHKIIDCVIVKGDEVHIYFKGTESARMCHREQDSK